MIFFIINTSINIANAVQEDDTSSHWLLSTNWLRLMIRWRVQPPSDDSSQRDKLRNTYDFYEQMRDSARAHCKPFTYNPYERDHWEVVDNWASDSPQSDSRMSIIKRRASGENVAFNVSILNLPRTREK